MFRGVRRIFGGGKPKPAGAFNAPNAFSDTTAAYSPLSDDSLAPIGNHLRRIWLAANAADCLRWIRVNASYPPDAETIQRPN